MKDSIFGGILSSRRKAGKNDGELNSRWGDISISAPIVGGWSSVKPVSVENSPDSRHDQPPTPPFQDSGVDVQILNEPDQHYEDERIVAFKVPLNRFRSHERPKQQSPHLGFFKPEYPGIKPLSPPTITSNGQFPIHQAYTSPSLGSTLSPVDETFAKVGPSRHASPVTNKDMRSLIESNLLGLDSMVRTTPLSAQSPHSTFTRSIPLSTQSPQPMFVTQDGFSGMQTQLPVDNVRNADDDDDVCTTPIDDVLQDSRQRAIPTQRRGKRSQSADPFGRSRLRSDSIDNSPLLLQRKASFTADSNRRAWRDEEYEQTFNADKVSQEDSDSHDETAWRPRVMRSPSLQQQEFSPRVTSPSTRPPTRPQAWQPGQTIGLPLRPNASQTIRRLQKSEGERAERPLSTESARSGFTIIDGSIYDGDTASIRSGHTTSSRTAGIYNEIESDYARLRHDMAYTLQDSRFNNSVTNDSRNGPTADGRKQSASRMRGLKSLGSRHKQRLESDSYASANESDYNSGWESEIVSRSRNKTENGEPLISPTFSVSTTASNTTPPLSASLFYPRPSLDLSHARKGSDSASAHGSIQVRLPSGPAPKQLVPNDEEIWG